MNRVIAKLVVATLLFSVVPPLNNVEATSAEEKEVIVPSPQQEQEIVGKRTSTSQVFKQEDGSYKMEIYSEPIHVQDEETKNGNRLIIH